jgi:hypothetical protein
MDDLPFLYRDLPRLRALYQQGVNISRELRKIYGNKYNSTDIIEIVYEVQAGSYVDLVESNHTFAIDYCREISSRLASWVLPSDVVLDVGTGELTTFGPVMSEIPCKLALACDISLSRLLVGLQWLAKRYPGVHQCSQSFVADLARLPLPDSSVDVIWSSHALEPNHGREHSLLTELFRVARKYLILFEPYYEGASSAAQARMRSLGYVRNLEGVVRELGGHLIDCQPLPAASNNLNKTHCFVIAPPQRSSLHPPVERFYFASPISSAPLLDIEASGFLGSSKALIGYPVVCGIPLLRQRYVMPMMRSDLLHMPNLY